MAITEESRHHLYQRLEELLGHDEATTLMEHLPPVGWADVATRHDLEASALLTRTELRSEMQALGSELRSEMQALGSELRSETQEAMVGLSGQIKDLRAEVHRELRVQLLAMITGFAALAALLLTAG